MSIKSLPRFVQRSQLFTEYWRFAAERQRIYHRRVRGDAAPWTTDPILRTAKFTNAYRASDRTSQYLIANVIYREGLQEEDVILRILLFKLFNKIETWELLRDRIGDIRYRTFSSRRISQVLQEHIDANKRIYSAAYILPPAATVLNAKRKHETHLALIDQMLDDGFVGKAHLCKTLQDLYNLVRGYPMFGPFLAFQMATDIAYTESTNLNEDGFVVAGPGALRGIRKCFTSLGGLSAAQLILLLTERQDVLLEEAGAAFDDLWGRALKPIDCQNLFCEFDKYCRVAFPTYNRPAEPTRIKQRFRCSGMLPRPWFPPKWGINERIDGTAQDWGYSKPLQKTLRI